MKIPRFLKVLKREILIRSQYDNIVMWQKNLKNAKRYKKNAKELINNKYYCGIKRTHSDNKIAICIYDGKIKSGGFADRLRGIISIYKTSKDLNINFKILYSSPFELTRYLEPNIVQWEITPQELNYNLNETDICVIESYRDRPFEKKKQEKWFRNEFKKDYNEFHIRTNACYSYEYNYAELFHELFKPSHKLNELIETHKKFLGKEYISTSFRFLDLLGDFDEVYGCCKTLTKEEQRCLIEKNIQQLEYLHNKYPGIKILVNSDSITFLKSASKLEYTYIIPGAISHTDNNAKTVPIEIHDKTLTDFFMIANASSIYTFITGNMRRSGFPYAASLIYNKPFNVISF